MYVLESLIMEQKIKNNQTYFLARDKIYSENAHLVKQIKTLKTKKTSQSYSTVAASASATDQLMHQQQQFFAQQQQLFVQHQKQMQQQMITIMNLLKRQSVQTSNTIEIMDESSSNVNKRSRTP